MTRFFRFVATVALCIFLAGCSGYRQVAWRTSEQASEAEESGDRDELEVGDRVRVTLVTGENIEGEFISINSDSITIIAGPFREEEGVLQTYAWTGIIGIERYKDGGLAAGVAAISAVTFLALTANAYAQTTDGFME